MADRKENLFKNTVLFTVGNLGSKLLQFILVPYYTFVMTDSEFGTADILQAVVSLLMPVFSLTIYEGVFRYAMEKEYDKSAVFSCGILISAAGTAVMCLIGATVTLFSPYQYLWLLIFYTAAGLFRSLLSQYARAIGRTGFFTLDNVLLTVYVVVLNIFFITVMHLSVQGYLLGYAFANLISCLFLIVVLRKSYKIDFKKITKPVFKEMLRYSIPLIPNTVCWWISNFIDRVFILSIMGASANGLYAAAHKIPSLLTMIVTIFFQAWQISANEEFRKSDINTFYTEIFEQIFAAVTLASSFLILLCRPITSLLLSRDFFSSWEYMPVLLLAMTFFSFAQFLGSIYSANRHTGMALVTNVISVIINLCINYPLIKWMGTVGAGVATAISYFVFWIIRAVNTRKIVKINYCYRRLGPAVLILIAQALLITLDVNLYLKYIFTALGTMGLIILFKKTLITLFGFVIRFFLKKRKAI